MKLSFKHHSQWAIPSPLSHLLHRRTPFGSYVVPPSPMTARGTSPPGAHFGSPSEMRVFEWPQGTCLGNLVCAKLQLGQLSLLAPPAFAGHAVQKALSATQQSASPSCHLTTPCVMSAAVPHASPARTLSGRPSPFLVASASPGAPPPMLLGGGMTAGMCFLLSLQTRFGQGLRSCALVSRAVRCQHNHAVLPSCTQAAYPLPSQLPALPSQQPQAAAPPTSCCPPPARPRPLMTSTVGCRRGRTGQNWAGMIRGKPGVSAGVCGCCPWCVKLTLCSPPASSYECPRAHPPLPDPSPATQPPSWPLSLAWARATPAAAASNASSSAGGGTGRFSVGSPPVSLYTGSCLASALLAPRRTGTCTLPGTMHYGSSAQLVLPHFCPPQARPSGGSTSPGREPSSPVFGGGSGGPPHTALDTITEQPSGPVPEGKSSVPVEKKDSGA